MLLHFILFYTYRFRGYGGGYGFRRGRDGPRDNPTPSRCLGVFGLSLSTQERSLYDVFSRYGEVEDVSIVYDNYTGKLYFKDSLLIFGSSKGNLILPFSRTFQRIWFRLHETPFGRQGGKERCSWK